MRTAPASFVALLLLASSPAFAQAPPRPFEPLTHLAPPVPSETYGVATTWTWADWGYDPERGYIIDGLLPEVPSEDSLRYTFFRVNGVTRALDLEPLPYYPRALVLDGVMGWPAPWGAR